MKSLLLRTAISVGIFLLVSESLLRVIGNGPRNPDQFASGRLGAYEPDDLLGWRKRSNFEKLSERLGHKIVFSTDDRGERKTSTHNDSAHKPDWWIIGGSFVEGSPFLDDSETFPALLQERLPDKHIRNLGVAAYGTYQSSLSAKQLLESGETPEKLILGLVDFAQERNVGQCEWLRMLKETNPAFARLPIVSLDENGNLFRSVARYQLYPLRASSALMATLEFATCRLGALTREQQKRAVLVKLLKELKSLTQAYNVDFRIVALASLNEPSESLLRSLQPLELPITNCIPGDGPLNEYALEEDGHPNADLNRHWAECLSRALSDSANQDPMR